MALINLKAWCGASFRIFEIQIETLSVFLDSLVTQKASRYCWSMSIFILCIKPTNMQGFLFFISITINMWLCEEWTFSGKRFKLLGIVDVQHFLYIKTSGWNPPFLSIHLFCSKFLISEYWLPSRHHQQTTSSRISSLLMHLFLLTVSSNRVMKWQQWVISMYWLKLLSQCFEAFTLSC